MNKILGSFGGGISIGGMLGIVGRGKDILNEVATLSRRLNITVESASVLRQTARLAGVEISTLETAFFRLNRTLGEATQEGADAAKGLEKLGISVSALTAMDADKQLEAIAQALALLPTHAERSFVAFQIFSRQAQDVLPFLNRIAKTGMATGIVTAADVEALREQKKAGKDLESVLDALAVKLQVSLAPAMEVATRHISGVANSLRSLLEMWEDNKDVLSILVGAGVGGAMFGRAGAVMGAGMGAGSNTLTGAGGGYLVAGPWGAGIGGGIGLLMDIDRQLSGGTLAELRARHATREAERVARDRAGGIASRDAMGRVLSLVDTPLAPEHAAEMEAVLARLAAINEAAAAASIWNRAFQSIVAGAERFGELLEQFRPAMQELALLDASIANFGLSQIEIIARQMEALDTDMGDEAARQLREREATLNRMLNVVQAINRAHEDAAAIFDSTRTPLERFAAQMERLDELLVTEAFGALDSAEAWDTYARGVAQAVEQLERVQHSVAAPIGPAAIQQGSAAAISAANRARNAPSESIQERIAKAVEAARRDEANMSMRLDQIATMISNGLIRAPR